ncbi:MAG: site-specific DNA-methyltransferase [Clostridiales bacterium]|nr:site-specific DNA-methyltransferase [Clostridiales bacterium]
MEKLELNKIINSDTVKTLKTFPDKCVDLIFVDPPYWMRVEGELARVNGKKYNGCDEEWDNQFQTLEDYQNFTRAWLSECIRILKDNGSFWVIGGMQCIYTIGAIMQEAGMWIINDVIWSKTNPTPNFKGTRINNAHETLIWAVKNSKSRYTFNYKTAKELNRDTVHLNDYYAGVRKQLTSVWRVPVCQGNERIKDEFGNKLHATQKPEELLYRIIAISSKLGDLILDPFGGTMTTAAVAKRMGRNYICIDNNAKYCEYGQNRVDNTQVLIGNIECALYDQRPPRVTFEEMIDAGYFTAGERLYYKEKCYLILTKNGKGITSNGDTTDIHSGIAKVIGGTSTRLNGWDYWEVKRNDTFVCIDEIRQRYLKEVKHYE